MIGNAFSWLVSPKNRLVLYLKEKRQISPNAWDFIFALGGSARNRCLAFEPEQYIEWTLGHEDPDSRGNRRYFTLASAPTEPGVRVGVRFSNPGSTYKEAMLELDQGDEIIAGQLAGDFTLPKDPRQPLIFIAGGIGIAPYRSMVKYLLDTAHRAGARGGPGAGQKRRITLFYSAPTVDDFVYTDVFERAERELPIRTVYVATKGASEAVNVGSNGQIGRINPEMIETYAPYYQEALFYISGPNAMVDGVKRMLGRMGIPDGQVKTDFFAGL